MAKLSILDMVQDILNDIDSDEVNSIDDTVEAAQVAQIVKSTYFAMMSNRNWPHLRRAVHLVPTTDLAQPTHMYVKESIKELVFINYDCRKTVDDRSSFKKMQWREPDEFLQIINAYNEFNDNVDKVQDSSGIDLFIMNDRAPTVYTSFDDRTLVFNAYNSNREANLESTFIQAMAYVMPHWIPADDHIPDLPEEAFTALLEEAKSRAALKLRQAPDQKAEQEAGRQQRWLARRARRVAGGIKFPDYGRHR